MKRIKLQEASSLTSYDKMRLFDQGQRKENVKACGTPKLVTYYKICLNNGFNSAERQIAAELCARGLDAYVVPQAKAIDASQFTPYEAQYVLKHLDSPAEILRAATHRFPNLTESETLTVYLIWAIVLDAKKVIDAIKVLMQSYRTYADRIPQIVDNILSQQGVADIISDICKKLP